MGLLNCKNVHKPFVSHAVVYSNPNVMQESIKKKCITFKLYISNVLFIIVLVSYNA